MVEFVCRHLGVSMNEEFYLSMARSERAFANDRRESAESRRIHLKNAEEYERWAEVARAAKAESSAEHPVDSL